MPSPAIRLATHLDAAAIARVHVESWRQTYTGLLPEAMVASLDVVARREMWASLLSEPAPASATMALVLESEGEIVGFGACGAQRSPELAAAGYDGEVAAIYILDRARGHGSGRILMRRMASLLSTRGRTGVGLWVLADNHRARRFYERLGGRIVGQREDRRPQALLAEVAYGWPDLRSLAA